MQKCTINGIDGITICIRPPTTMTNQIVVHFCDMERKSMRKFAHADGLLLKFKNMHVHVARSSEAT